MPRSSQNSPGILLLAEGSLAQYRVLRCAAALGGKVQVAGGVHARMLALSRYCSGFHDFDLAARPKDAAARIDAIAQANGLALVLGADVPATRLLICARPHLRTAAYPLPALEAFDALATKDAFMALCRKLNIAHPEGAMFAGKSALLDALESGALRLPAMLKPVDTAGGIGVRRIDTGNARGAIENLGYAPVLVQDFVEGEDWSITVFCREGQVLRRVVYAHPDAVFAFARKPALEDAVAGIVRRMNLNGIFNFDARIGPDGKVWMIECNPRFFFNMDVTMVAGLNFAGQGNATAQAPEILGEGTVRLPQALIRQLLKGCAPSALDWKMLAHWLRDPAIFALVMSGYRRVWRSDWLEKIAANWKTPRLAATAASAPPHRAANAKV